MRAVGARWDPGGKQVSGLSGKSVLGGTTSRFVLVGAALIIVLAACAEETPQAPTTTVITMTMDEGEDGHDHEHAEEGREWEGTPPVLGLSFEEGPNGPIAVLEASGFSFGDPSTEEYVPGFGHTHVFVDGRLLDMSYDPSFPLGELAPGTHHVEVTLASGDHADYLIDGEALGAVAMLEVAGEVEQADLAITVGYADGSVEVPEDRYELSRHDIVEITITSDVAEEVHVHGYDISREVAAGGTTTLRFTVDIPGVFEVELELSGQPLFELTVTS